jgi:hypothetical protein
MSTSIRFFGLHVAVDLWKLVCGGFIQLANSGLVTIGGYLLHRSGRGIEVAGYDRSGEAGGVTGLMLSICPAAGAMLTVRASGVCSFFDQLVRTSPVEPVNGASITALMALNQALFR